METKELAKESFEIMIRPWRERTQKAEADNVALRRALEVATSSDAYDSCVFNGVEKEFWPEYCNKEHPGENLHTTCVKCWCDYYIQKALADLEKEE